MDSRMTLFRLYICLHHIYNVSVAHVFIPSVIHTDRGGHGWQSWRSAYRLHCAKVNAESGTSASKRHYHLIPFQQFY